MKLAIHNSNFTWSGGPEAIAPTLAAVARAAEQGGADTITVMDHYFQIERASRAEDPMLEAYATLGYIAAVTERIKIGALVTSVTYRHPGLLAKIITTLDVLSEGRAFFGIGGGWYEREHEGLGVEFPPVGERLSRMVECIEIVKQMWSGEVAPFKGTYYELAETLNVPPAIQKPPPILIGGAGEQRTLKYVARYADACNILARDFGTEFIAGKLEVLRRHCEAEGRDYDSIEKTALVPRQDPIGDTDGFLRYMEQLAEIGIEKAWISTQSPDPVPWVEQTCAKVVEPMAQLGPVRA